MLEKDREIRYQHASDLRADLNRLKRDSESAKFPAVLLKNKGLSRAFAFSAMAVVLIILLVIGWEYHRLNYPPAPPRLPLGFSSPIFLIQQLLPLFLRTVAW